MNAKNFCGALFFAGWLGCCGSLSADPLNNWHWRNPLPNGNPLLAAQSLNSIIFTNGTFFGVGNAGVVGTSTDSTNWTQAITATSSQLNDIICGGGKFVAAGNNGVIETSSDGTNWVLQNSGTTTALGSVAYGNGKFVAVGPGAVLASSDAANWTPAVSGLSGAGAVAGGSFGFVAIGSTNAYFSSDGLHWTYHPLAAPQGYNLFTNNPVVPEIVTFFNGSFLIGAYKYVTSESVDYYIWASTDGDHWTTNAIGNMITFSYGFTYSFFMTGNKQAIAGGEAGTTAFLQFSPDGETWTTTNVSLPDIYNNDGAYGNSSYVITSGGGKNFVSPDVINWSTQGYVPPSAAGPTGTFNSIAYSNGTYVVATSNSFVVSTNDASYLTASNTPSLSSVVSFGTNFVAVGSSGQIYTSTNGFSWAQRNSGTADNLHGVATGNNLLVAVGDNGAVQTSPTGVI
jgi:hypothetical protein